MEDWGKKLDEALQQKQHEKDQKEKQEKESKGTLQDNQKKAIKYISEVVVPAFVKAEELLQNRDMVAYHNRSDDGTSICMNVHKQGEMDKNISFQYCIDIICDKFGVSLTMSDHNVDISEVREEDIFNDIMEHFLNFVQK